MWSLRREFLLEHLHLTDATGVEGARWEHFQLAHLADENPLRIEAKSRQIAWSWLIAAEAVAEAILEQRDSIFVSINQREATEKIRYARQIIAALRPDVRPTLKRNNELELELANGARLTSLPARPPRGRARANVYLDEFAHAPHDRAIYTAALPVISKGGRLRIGSSPLGANGVFWEIFGQGLRPYPGYTRKLTPWWHVSAFCTDLLAARAAAPTLAPADLIAHFGNDRIHLLYGAMPEEDFRQEYGAEFVDETTAWITWEEIQTASDPALFCLMSACQGAIDPALAALSTLRQAIETKQLEPVLAGGFDVGRVRNTSELYLVGVSPAGPLPLRLAISLDNTPFDAQADLLAAALATLPISKLLIDQTGIGRQLAEGISKRFPGKAEGVDFTTASKTLWATHAKMLIQQRKTPLPVDRELAYQIHSIKRMVTPSKNLLFDTERNEKHHADRFWAWALALSAASAAARSFKLSFL